MEKGLVGCLKNASRQLSRNFNNKHPRFALASPLDLKNGTRSGARPASFSETAADDVRRFVSTVLDYESGIDGDLRNSSATNVGESGLDPH